MKLQSLNFKNWFAPHTFEAFRETFLGKQPFSAPGRPGFAEHVSRVLGIQSLDDILALDPSRVHGWFHSRDGRHATAELSTIAARRLHDGGLTIFVENIPSFSAHESEMAEAFALPQSAVKCAFFCNRPGATTRVHFDCVDTIMVQLKGRKTWRVAPNTFAPAPVMSWATLSEVPLEMRIYASDEPPTKIPNDAKAITMEEGAILHVPRGYWHETDSDEDSLSLHILMRPPIWENIVLQTLRNELLRDERWRQSNYGIGAGTPQAVAHASTMLALLRGAVARISASDVVVGKVHAGPGDGERFVRCGQVSFGVDAIDASSGVARVTVVAREYKATRTTELRVDTSYLAAARWVSELETGVAFDVSDVRLTAPALDDGETRTLLAMLERVGLVRRPAARET